MTERILYLVRHGESDFDSTRTTRGPRGEQWDPPLGERGREQASIEVVSTADSAAEPSDVPAGFRRPRPRA